MKVKNIGLFIRRIVALFFTGLCIYMPISEYLNGAQPHVVAVTAFMGFMLWCIGIIALSSGIEEE